MTCGDADRQRPIAQNDVIQRDEMLPGRKVRIYLSYSILMVIDFDFVRFYFGDIDPCKMDSNEMDNENFLLPKITTEFLGRHTRRLVRN